MAKQESIDSRIIMPRLCLERVCVSGYRLSKLTLLFFGSLFSQFNTVGIAIMVIVAVLPTC
jgi:hypothetical protein